MRERPATSRPASSSAINKPARGSGGQATVVHTHGNPAGESETAAGDQLIPATVEWAAAVTSTPHNTTGNRFALLAVDSDQNDIDADDNQQPFTTVVRSHRRMKRGRQVTS